MTENVQQFKVNRKRLCHQRRSIRIAVLGLTTIFSFWAGVHATAEDIQWLNISVPEYGKNRFKINKIQKIRAFALDDGGNEPNYDVALVDDYGRMVRMDVASGKHWELTPREFDKREPRSQRLFFKLQVSEQNEQYLGRLYYPWRGYDVAFESNGRTLSARSLAPYPTKDGFQGIIVSSNQSYRFTSNRRLGEISVTPLVPLRIGSRTSYPGVTLLGGGIDGQILGANQDWVFTDRYAIREDYSNKLIACWQWEGKESFILRGADFRSLSKDWERLAAAPVSDSGGVIVVYSEGLIFFDGEKRQKAYPGGWKSPYRGNFLQFQNNGSRVQILMYGPDRQRELWTFDCKTLEVLQKFPLPSAQFDAAFEETAGILAVQTSQRNGELLLFKRHNLSDTAKFIGRTSPFTAAVGRAECWTLSDDGKMIFFVSRPDVNKSQLKLGHISVESLQFKESKTTPVNGSGFAGFSQDEMSFEELPTNATDAVVGILPEAHRWLKISPNDRWVIGNGGESVSKYDLHLYDTLSRKSHFLPELGGDSAHAFSADSSLLSIFKNGRVVQVWDVAGSKPFLLASNDRLPKVVREELRPLLTDARSGGCFVSSDSVATTNQDGSVRFRIDGPDLKVVYQSDKLKSRYAEFSNDGSSLAIFKDEGDIWRYKWTGETWKGVAKFKVPFFSRNHGRSTLRAMSPETDGLVIYGYKSLTIWNDLQNHDKEPLTTVGKMTNALGHSTLMDLAGVSQNRQWIAYLRNNEHSCDLTLVNRQLKTVATQSLPFRFVSYNGGFLITNDGKHALVSDKSDHTYVIRLQAE